MVLHAGDVTSSRNTFENYKELLDFKEWFTVLNIKHKVMTAGNHDVCMERLPGAVDMMKEVCHVLLHDEVEIEGFKIFGSPYSPTFGKGWAFNKSRSKIGQYWRQIPDDTDILVTHGMPYGIGDLTTDHESGKIIPVGDTALLKRIKQVGPQYAIAGHIHSFNSGNREIHNAGIYQLAGLGTKLINASVVKDGEMQIYHNGFVIELPKKD